MIFKFSRKFVYTASIIVVFAIIITILFSSTIFKTVEAQDLMKDIKPRTVDIANSITEQYISSTQSFSIDLFRNSYKSGENILVSPTSAVLALGMATNGADGTTLKEFEKVLGHNTINNLNKAYKAYSNELTQKRGSTVLDIFNSAWIRKDFNVKRDFLQINADFFNADARTLDFNDKASVNVINNWIKGKTGGEIDRIVEEIKKDDVMYLISALNFEAKWKKPFRQQTDNTKFYLENGTTVNTAFMNLEDSISYTENPNQSAILLPYDDDRFAFLCILPEKGTKLKEYINNMSQWTIPDLLKSMKKTELIVSLPPFKASANYELKDILRSMGLKTAFDDVKADFSKMSADSSGLYISSVKQSTFLQVDELGTKAGAATSVTITKELAPRSIVFNRPFIYAVIDTQTGLPLFLGALQRRDGFKS